MKPFQKIALALIVSIGLLFLFRTSILRGVGNFLIYENPLAKVDGAFVLSGGSLERGLEAIKMAHAGYVKNIYTTGEIVNPTLLALGIDSLSDAVISRDLIAAKMGGDSVLNEKGIQIRALPFGTSTQEESEGILAFCSSAGFTRIMIISSKFHTRRIKQVFKQKFRRAGINVVVRGAPPLTYQVENWWNSEEALIFVNNEYVKMLYYKLKY